MTPIEIRHHLHQHPELSGCEVHTHDFIVGELRKCRPAVIYEHVGAEPGNSSYGVVAVWGDVASGNHKPSAIAFRADIDALPINETLALDYCSQVPHVGHKCGHDGHTAILLRLAQLLGARADVRTAGCQSVVMVFQPEEETGTGSKKILRSGILQQYDIRAIYGIHNLPGFLTNHVVLIRGTFAAASSGFIVRLYGRQTHASTPEKGLNPGLAVADLIKRFDAFNAGHEALDDTFCMSTLICARVGEEAFGTSAGDGYVAFTLRAFSNKTIMELLQKAEETVREVASLYGLQYETELREPFYATENDGAVVDALHKRCIRLELPANTVKVPFRWSEDFADYLMQFPGAMFGIGAGRSHVELHHPDYDFPDEIIEPTAQLFYKLIF
ncbi:MAG: amidohydrolase [Bacteroidales bacterium]|nr:amidohydrolase [Bacteroidales bacterium]